MPEKKDKSDIFNIPLFPLYEVVLFPGMDLPLHIFEECYKELISKCLERDKRFGVVLAQGDEYSEIGTICEIIDCEKLKDEKMNILVEGKSRFKIHDFLKSKPYFEVSAELYEDKAITISPRIKKMLSEARRLSRKTMRKFDKVFEQQLSKKLKLPEDPNEFLFLIAANLTCSYEVKQSILETCSIKERIEKLIPLLKEEVERLDILAENKETKEFVTKNGKLEI